MIFLYKFIAGYTGVKKLFEVQTKIKRQVEILGLILNNPGLKTFDLADLFKVEELTIKRDLQALRNYGIDIHSQKKKGICVSGTISKHKIGECIAYYTGIINPVSLTEKATMRLVEKRGMNALKNLVTLQQCIENSCSACIQYNKEGDKISERNVNPLLIFHNEGNWRLLTKDLDKFKQFILTKIIHVQATNIKFRQTPSPEFENLFRFSWKSWIGDDKFNVKLELSDHWAEAVKANFFLPDQKLYRTGEGINIFEATVNTLQEITVWILSLGKGVRVLEPEELKQKVLLLAGEVVSNYETEPVPF